MIFHASAHGSLIRFVQSRESIVFQLLHATSSQVVAFHVDGRVDGAYCMFIKTLVVVVVVVAADVRTCVLFGYAAAKLWHDVYSDVCPRSRDSADNVADRQTVLVVISCGQVKFVVLRYTTGTSYDGKTTSLKKDDDEIFGASLGQNPTDRAL